MGASKPEEYGYYFWWGDTLGCRRDGDAWVSSNGSITSFQFCSDISLQTYNKNGATLQSEGWITADYVLAPEHDAAAARSASTPYQKGGSCQCGSVTSSNVASSQSGGSFTYCNKSGRARSDVSDDALRTFTVIELSASLRLNYGEAMWYHTTL